MNGLKSQRPSGLKSPPPPNWGHLISPQMLAGSVPFPQLQVQHKSSPFWWGSYQTDNLSKRMVGAFQSPSRLVKHCSNPEELLVGWCRASLLLKIAVAKQLHFGLLLQSKAVSGSCFPDLQVQGTVCYMISSTAGIRTCSLPGTCTGRSLKHGTVANLAFEKSNASLSLTFLLLKLSC